MTTNEAELRTAPAINVVAPFAKGDECAAPPIWATLSVHTAMQTSWDVDGGCAIAVSLSFVLCLAVTDTLDKVRRQMVCEIIDAQDLRAPCGRPIKPSAEGLVEALSYTFDTYKILTDCGLRLEVCGVEIVHADTTGPAACEAFVESQRCHRNLKFPLIWCCAPALKRQLC